MERIVVSVLCVRVCVCVCFAFHIFFPSIASGTLPYLSMDPINRYFLSPSPQRARRSACDAWRYTLGEARRQHETEADILSTGAFCALRYLLIQHLFSQKKNLSCLPTNSQKLKSSAQVFLTTSGTSVRRYCNILVVDHVCRPTTARTLDSFFSLSRTKLWSHASL